MDIGCCGGRPCPAPVVPAGVPATAAGIHRPHPRLGQRRARLLQRQRRALSASGSRLTSGSAAPFGIRLVRNSVLSGQRNTFTCSVRTTASIWGFCDVINTSPGSRDEIVQLLRLVRIVEDKQPPPVRLTFAERIERRRGRSSIPVTAAASRPTARPGRQARRDQRELVSLDPPDDLVVAAVSMRVLDGHGDLPDAAHPLQRLWQDRGDVAGRVASQPREQICPAGEVLVALRHIPQIAGTDATKPGESDTGMASSKSSPAQFRRCRLMTSTSDKGGNGVAGVIDDCSTIPEGSRSSSRQRSLDARHSLGWFQQVVRPGQTER